MGRTFPRVRKVLGKAFPNWGKALDTKPLPRTARSLGRPFLDLGKQGPLPHQDVADELDVTPYTEVGKITKINVGHVIKMSWNCGRCRAVLGVKRALKGMSWALQGFKL